MGAREPLILTKLLSGRTSRQSNGVPVGSDVFFHSCATDLTLTSSCLREVQSFALKFCSASSLQNEDR